MRLVPQRRDDRWERAIDALDPEKDAHRIVMILANHVFPIDFLIATELGQLTTFGIPSISALLHATGEYEREGVKRVEDTKAVLVELSRAGPASDGAKQMMEHLNHIHAHYRISNDDYLYTLSTFVVGIDDWMSRHGHRPLRPGERRAAMALYRAIGEAMHIRDIPATVEEYRAWARGYERRARRYTEANRQVADGLIGAFVTLAPRPLARLVRPLITALILDDAQVEALGLTRPAAPVRAVVGGALALRRRLLRHVSFWHEDRFWDSRFFNTYLTYPHGYERLRLGPKKIIDMLERRRAS